MFLCYMISVLYIVRFSNVESVVCVNGNEFFLYECNVGVILFMGFFSVV